MIDVRALTKDDWAKYALLVIYAWDMCDIQQDPASDALDPRILADGWTAVGIISGADNVVATAPSAGAGIPPANAGLRQSIIRPGADIRRYGYLAHNAVADTYVAVIRGTDFPEEWLDDFIFIAKQKPPFPGSVEEGFTDIYLSMTYRPIGGGPAVPLVDGIKSAVGGADVLVLGHSLGSCLAECLAFQLADPACLGSDRTAMIVYASPKLGDHDFVNGFVAGLANYIVINFEHDAVPHVPPFDITHLDIYRALPYVYAITDENALATINISNLGCCHHLIDYIAMLSQTVYTTSQPFWTNDEKSCATCVLQALMSPSMAAAA